MKELAAIRRSKGLTQKELAEKAGLDQATISKIERRSSDYNYTADTVKKLSDALQVEPAELFGLPELQQRVLNALRSIDPERQAAAVVVLEAMATRRNE